MAGERATGRRRSSQDTRWAWPASRRRPRALRRLAAHSIGVESCPLCPRSWLGLGLFAGEFRLLILHVATGHVFYPWPLVLSDETIRNARRLRTAGAAAIDDQGEIR